MHRDEKKSKIVPYRAALSTNNIKNAIVQYRYKQNRTTLTNMLKLLPQKKERSFCARQKQYKLFETHIAAKELMLPAAKAITSTGELSETNQQNAVI